MNPSEFDYIVVGAGSAGCALASRLSENPLVSVCLIEAGGEDHSPLIHVPLGFIKLVDHPKYSWQMRSIPQRHADNRVMTLAAGKVLGGSSSINSMIYHRGQAGDYDDWTAVADGWGWEDVRAFYERSERNETFGPNQGHGNKGPLNVKFLDRKNPLTDVFIAAADECGLASVDDFTRHPIGAGRRQVTHLGRWRRSAARAYISPHRHRPNLTLMLKTSVTKVLLEQDTAKSVVLTQNSVTKTITCRKEVILAAGALQSPKLLMLSGIGPKAELARHNIPLRLDLPNVGTNLQDHLCVTVACAASSEQAYGLSLRSLPKRIVNVLEFFTHGRGLLCFAGEAGAYISFTGDRQRPDVQLSFIPALTKRPGSFSTQHGYSTQAVLLYPHSRGNVRLQSADPAAPPLVDPNYLSDPRDLETLIKGLNYIRSLNATAALSKHFRKEISPGASCEAHADLARFVRRNAASIFHFAGTCAMGRQGDSVVDHDLKVHGLKGLRVCDNSVMPSLIGGNTNAPAMMIAEKLAHKIRIESHNP